ncbi:glycosyltransferase [Vibrio splendidus]
MFVNFSVLMSLYNAESSGNLDSCLNSLFNQTHQADEIVIVYDGPINIKLRGVVDSWKGKLPIVTHEIKENIGLGKALNFGLNKCAFELVARMDTDDIAFPYRFEKQISQFIKNPKLDICGSSIDEFSEDETVILSSRNPPIEHNDIKKNCLLKNPFNHMTVMYKKSKVLEAGSYMHLPWMEDWYLWLRMLSIGSVTYNISQSLVLARTGEAMISRRSGFKYVISEWLLTKEKVRLNLSSWPKAFSIFLARSVPRILPKKILFGLYIRSRRS